jgi:hypothetical protein
MRVKFSRSRFNGWFWIPIGLAAAGALAIAFLPWESLGAPVLMVLLAGGAALGWVLRDSPPEERRFVLRLFLAALGVRLLATVVFYALTRGDPKFLFKDAIGYDRLAWILAQAWHNHGILPEALGRLAWVEDDAYPRALAGLYYVIGRGPGAAVALNAVLGSMSVYLVYRISVILFGPLPARWAGWLTVFYTGFWLWGMMLLKDTLFLFFLLLFFLALYRLWHLLIPADFSRVVILRAAGWAAAMILAWAGAGAIRDNANYASSAMAVAVVALPLVWFLRSAKIWRWVLVLAVLAIGVVILWPRIGSYALPHIAVNDQSLLFQATEAPETGTVSVFMKWIIGHPLSFGRYLLLSTASTALAPYAWILPGTVSGVTGFDSSMIAFPGLWMWYALIPFAVLGLIPAIRRTKGDVWPMVIFGAGIFLAVSIFIPREFRHRDMIMPIALMFAAEGLVFSRRWWYLGLVFWIPLAGFIAWKLHSPVPVLLAAILAAFAGIVWRVNRKRRTQNSLPGKET